ncbi:MAG: TetR/AcrR family transcriptional regulator [Deltaproteobacteria bacterium]|nr:TetR/AcrR family transcriptional regulator [Deltaproteobacteria bacterium]
MPRAQRLSVDKRRARLLELGLELFGQRAFDAVSTDDIALAGGVSKGLLYHYFANKRGYYVATIRELARRVVEVTRMDDDKPLELAIRGALRSFVGFVRDNATFYRTLMRGGAGVDDEVRQIIDEARHAMVRRVLERAGIREPQPVQRVAFFGWAGFAESACLHWLDHETDMPESELIEMMVGALLLLLAHAGPRVASRN